MRFDALWRRLVVPAAVAGLALTGLATPAHAEPTPDPDAMGDVAIMAPEQITVIEGKTKTVRVPVMNIGVETAKGVRVTFEHVTPALGLTLPDGCDATGCAVGDLKPAATKTFALKLAPTQLTSTFRMTSHGDGIINDSVEITVIRTKSGVDLEVAPIEDFTLGRGATKDLPIVVRNTGADEVGAIGVVVIAESGLEALTKFRNCEVEDLEEELGMTATVCVFDQKFAPDTIFTLPRSTPIQIRAAKTLGGPYTYTGVVAVAGLNRAEVAKRTGKSGPTLELEAMAGTSDLEDDFEDSDDINGEDNVAPFGVKLPKSSADAAAIGATFAGEVGEESTVGVGIRNLGPTNLIYGTERWMANVRVTIPTGIELTEVDENCAPGKSLEDVDFIGAGEVDGRDYVCLVIEQLDVRDEGLFSFAGTIGEGPHSGGAVVADGGIQDGNKANDRATLGVKATSAGEGGGGLPVTGAPAGLVALGGAVLLLGGAAAFFVARRRKIVTTV